jgi:ATP-dependent exoDNAse (exonuclease V) beta subunit
MVDDLQDATPAQLALLAEIAGAATSVVATIDPDSRIYGYRGAATDAEAEFLRALPGAAEHTLDVPHRTPARREAWLFEHGADEAAAIARECRRLRAQDGIGYGEIAIVVRRLGGHERVIGRALAEAGVPSVVVGGNRALRSEPALRPLFLLAEAARAEGDARETALLAVMATPACGLDPYEVRGLRREARIRNLSIGEIVDGAPNDLPGDLTAKIGTLRACLEHARTALAMGPADGFFHLWGSLPYVHDMVASEDAVGLDAATALARALERYAERSTGATFADYLDVVADVEFGPEPWQMPEERRPDAVRILTAHATAGTEFDAVIVAGCVEGAFPAADGRRALLDVRDLLAPPGAPEPRAERSAEERRLFRVATTRARTTLILTASRRTSSGELTVPSPLVEQISLAWGAPPVPTEPITRAEAEAHARRTLVDPTASEADRKAALEMLARLPGVDPDTWWFERDRTHSDEPLYGEEFLASYSRLAPYDNCGLSYLYGREMGLDPESTHAMRIGSMVHEIFEIASKDEIARTKEAMIAALDERWDPSMFPNVAIEHRMRKDCERMIARWIEADGNVDPLAVEVEFAFDVEGATIRGYIDRIVRCGGKSTRVIDYKTGRTTKTDAECVDDLQLATYYLALTRDPKLAELGDPMRMELAFIASDYWKSRPGVDPRRIPNYAENAVERIEALVAGIRAEDFSPREEADCKWCSFKPLCPLWPEGQEVSL